MEPEGVEAIIASLDWTKKVSGEVVVVLYGYFDDSGSDDGSPVVVMAGYLAHAKGWKRFESATKDLFKNEGIPFFRAKLFDHGQKQFRRWSDARRLRFATEWYGLARGCIVRGCSTALVKADFVAAQKMDRKLPSISAEAYCMQMTMEQLWQDPRLWPEIQAHGLHIIIESSTKADGGIRHDFERVVRVNQLEGHLRSITFAKKETVRALQIADYLAYYSHRFALTAQHESVAGRTPFLDIAQGDIETIMKMGERFTPNPDYRALLAKAKAPQKQPS